MKTRNKHYPVKHIVGFFLSIALTLIAAWTALMSDLPTLWVVIGILILAIIQAGIQLVMFMHIIEAGVTHAPWNMMFHAFVVATIVVGGSLFTMSFGFMY